MEKLIQGKYYHISLLSPYDTVGSYDVKVSSIAKKATVSDYGDFDIRSTFFTPAGVGIGTYLSTVTDETDIYICLPITSFDPPEVDEAGYIHIPASIIDFNNCEEFKEVVRYQLNIEGVRRHFDTEYQRNEFLNKLDESVSNALNRETILANDILSISSTEEELIVQQSVIDKEEKERETYIQERENAIHEREVKDAEREMSYYERLAKLKAKEDEVEKNRSEYITLIKQGEVSKNIGAQFLLNVNDLMNRIRDLYAQFTTYANTYAYPIPEWDNLFRLVYNNADGRGGSNMTTDEWLEMMKLIAQGSIPEDLQNVELSDCPLCGTHVKDIINGTTSETTTEED